MTIRSLTLKESADSYSWALTRVSMPVIDRVFPFEEYQQAMSLLESDQFVGKIVLRLDESPTPRR